MLLGHNYPSLKMAISVNCPDCSSNKIKVWTWVDQSNTAQLRVVKGQCQECGKEWVIGSLAPDHPIEVVK